MASEDNSPNTGKVFDEYGFVIEQEEEGNTVPDDSGRCHVYRYSLHVQDEGCTVNLGVDHASTGMKIRDCYYKAEISGSPVLFCIIEAVHMRHLHLATVATAPSGLGGHLMYFPPPPRDFSK